MRKSLIKGAVLLLTAGSALLTMPALADEPQVTVRVEPGAAVPLTSPQVDRFKVGADVELKPTVGLTPWFDANLTLSGMALPSKISGVDYGQVLGIGLGARLKRPHDRSNTGSGLSAASPWIDADAQFIASGAVDRFAWSLGAGVLVPMSDSRSVWIGPFVRYVNAVDSLNDSRDIDSRDAHVLVLGISIEFGASVPQPTKKPAEPARVTLPAPTVAAVPVHKGETTVVDFTLVGKVQFPFDSAKPLPGSETIMKKALEVMKGHATGHVTIEGHASSEGGSVYNQKLSERRAQAVAAFFTKNGVSADRLTVRGFGEERSVASNKTVAGRVANRRVEFTVKVTITEEEAK